MDKSLETVTGAATAYWLSRCIHVAAEAGVADALGDEPEHAAGLAKKIGANGDALNRVLRLLAAHGVFESRGGGHYAHNPASRLLRNDHPTSVRAFVRFIGSPLVWQSWGALEDSVRTGVVAAEKIVSGGAFTWFASHPEEAAIFNEAMVGKTHAFVNAAVAVCDFARFKTIADIGGGRGHLLLAALGAAPSARGVLFDLPHVIEDAKAIASDRLELQAGDFFESSLPTCDAYVLMEVIHDWADKEAHAILAAVRKAAPQSARVLLLESIVPSDPHPHRAKAMDINVLVMTGGRERTREEYDALLAGAGFRLDRVVDAPGAAMSLLEASCV